MRIRIASFLLLLPSQHTRGGAYRGIGLHAQESCRGSRQTCKLSHHVAPLVQWRPDTTRRVSTDYDGWVKTLLWPGDEVTVIQWRTITIVSTNRSSSTCGSSHSPQWTGDGCTIVLRGATSQRKRSACGSSPIGPAIAPPAQTSGMWSS